MDVETSELENPIAPRREVLRPLPRHSLAAHDEEAMAIGHDENRHVVRFAGLAPEGRENDLSLIFRGVDHVLAEGAYINHNRSQAARNSTRVVESPYPWGSKLAITEPMAKNPTKPPMAMKNRM
jgi:hypothetical protein